MPESGRIAEFRSGHLRVYHATQRMRAPWTAHRHDLHELNYYLSGGNTWTFAESGDSVDMRRHGLLLIRAGTLHSYDDHPGERCSILIDGSLLDDGPLDRDSGFSLASIFSRRHFDLSRDVRRHRIEQDIRQILNEPKDGGPSLWRVRQAVVDILIALHEAATPAPARRSRADEVMGHIRANFFRPITLRLLADETGMDYSSLSRLIKRHGGVPFVRLLNQLRISRACELLAGTDESIAGICFGCGYNDLAHFYRTFTRLVRQAPGDYRTTMRGKIPTNGQTLQRHPRKPA